jgi:hypothetical protein
MVKAMAGQGIQDEKLEAYGGTSRTDGVARTDQP